MSRSEHRGVQALQDLYRLANERRCYRCPVPRLTIKKTFVVFVSAVALFQLVAVTLAALPPNRYSDAAAPHTGYLRPMFTQNWRLFAPNPISEDRRLRFQGSYVADDGSLAQTEWVDWTSVELDLVRHRLVGGRAGYITNKLFSPLFARFEALPQSQRAAAKDTGEKDPPSWAELEDLLLAAGPVRSTTVSMYLRYERATTRLATEVLQARWPRLELTAVRYSMNRQAVTPYAARNGTEKEREAARPDDSVRIGGWRIPEVGSPAERRVIAEFNRRHR